jgi:hypothetical protein
MVELSKSQEHFMLVAFDKVFGPKMDTIPEPAGQLY